MKQGFTPIILIITAVLSILTIGFIYMYLTGKTNSKSLSNNSEPSIISLLPTNLPSPNQKTPPPVIGKFDDTTCGPDTRIYFDIQQALVEREDVCYLGLELKDFKQFPKEVYQLPYLKNLLLHSNNTPLVLPNDIDNLSSIVELELDTNGITSLPENVGNLKHIKQLNLSFNMLTTIPSSIGKLKTLEFLILADNTLISVPHEIGNLSNLKDLNLENNKLTTLPEEIKYLKNLLTLYLEGNNFSQAEQQRITRLLPPSTYVCFANCIDGE